MQVLHDPSEATAFAPIATSDRMLATIGRLVRDTRRAIGWSQAELGRRAGLSQAAVSLVERNALPDLTFRSAGRLLDALGIRVALVGEQPPLRDRERQHDAAHARCVAHVRARLERSGWFVATEVEIGDGRGRGWIDVLAFHPVEHVLLVIEIKTALDDLGAVERTLGRYERGAWAAARGLGWRPRASTGCLLLLDTSAVEAALGFNRLAIDQGFAVRATHLAEMVERPGGLPPRGARALALLDPLSRRARWLRPSRIDGRRSPAPYLDYADFMRRARTQGAHQQW